MKKLLASLWPVLFIATIIAAYSRLYSPMGPVITMTLLAAGLCFSYAKAMRSEGFSGPRLGFQLKPAVICLLGGGLLAVCWSGIACFQLTGSPLSCFHFRNRSLEDIYYVAILAAIIEELMTRGYISTFIIYFARSARIAAIIQAAIFAYLHAPGMDIVKFAFFMTGGLVFFYCARLYNNLVAPIALHIGWNFAMLVFNRSTSPAATEYERAWRSADGIFILIHLIIVVFLDRFIARRSRIRSATPVVSMNP